jgi:hypothetical protein
MSSIANFLDNPIVNNTLKLVLILYAGFMFDINSTHVHSWLNNKLFSYVFISLVIYALSKRLLFSFALTAAFYLVFYFLSHLEKKKSLNKTIKSVVADITSDQSNDSESELEHDIENKLEKEPRRRRKLRHAIDEKRKQMRQRNPSLQQSPIDPLPIYNNIVQIPPVQNTLKLTSTPPNNLVHPSMSTASTSLSTNTNARQMNQSHHSIYNPNTIVVEQEDDDVVSMANHVSLPKLKNKLQQFIDLQTSSSAGGSFDPQHKFIDISLKKEELVPFDKNQKHYTY